MPWSLNPAYLSFIFNLMRKNGPNFYDTDSVFEKYIALRTKSNSPNDTLERPILLEMIGSPQGKRVLDLGCGNAEMGQLLLDAGALSYTGVDGSKNMIELAERNRKDPRVQLVHSDLESFEFQKSAFDLVISSLVFHYLEDYELLLRDISKTLRPGGALIFSVEHPVLTSCNRSLELSAAREDWIVDQYFLRGAREIKWMGDVVTKYHRTIEDLLNGLSRSGLSLLQLRESDPNLKYFQDQALLQRRQRIPLFLFLAASKPLL
jgi:ubiquinone/menaquinone biosynthesis C-methylase UbiE